MTFYELIRASLIKDAEQHPYPKKDDGLSLLAHLSELDERKDDEGGS